MAKSLLSSQKLVASACISALTLIAFPQAAGAQAGTLEEIIVTARKREESVLDVPITETVLTSVRLQNLHITEVADLPKLVPGLVVGHSLLSIGTILSIRGVGTTTQDQGVDSSVAFNLDGLAVANGLAFQSGTFDLAQVEVLKGPQALFYGKSSPGGVISMRTADPTDELEVMGRVGYEDEAETYRGEFIISGPVSDTLKLRLAAMYADSEGYFKNLAIPDVTLGAAAPPAVNEPDAEHYIVRGTALWDPTERLSARIKVNFVHDEGTDVEAAQMVSCPDGTGPVPGLPDFIGGGEDCRFDDVLRVVSYSPEAFPGIMNDGHPFSDTDQFFTTVDISYDLTPELTLNSTTGWYDLENESLVNTQHSTHAAPALSAANKYTREDFTQEFRLNSDFAAPLNFTLGAFYQDGELAPRVLFIANRAMLPPFFWPFIDLDVRNTVSIETLSAFGQLRWQFAPEWELAVGARYTDETREQDAVDLLRGIPKPMVVSKIKDDNISPEVTLTYKPGDNVTLYGAYKEGFKSGSFSTSTPNVAVLDNAFEPEEVQGGELGLKSILLDNQLAFNAATYYYEYDGLQVGTILPQEGSVGVKTLNAGGAEVYGIEFDTAYNPVEMPGLTLNLALNWNHGRYTELDNVPCWGGQLISEGCNLIPNPATGRFTAQDLSGTQMVRAPDWQGNFGFVYEMPVANGYTLAFSNNNSYVDDHPTLLAVGRDDHIHDAYWKVDLSVMLRAPEDRWELALIGKNINDEISASFCSAAAFQAGVGIFPVTITGSTMRGPDGVDEIQCNSNPGREIWLRFTYNLF